MKKQLFNSIQLLLVLNLSSCASIFNSRQTHTSIVTNQPSIFTINGEENSQIIKQKEIWIDRTSKPLEIIVESAENKKTVTVNPKNC